MRALKALALIAVVFTLAVSVTACGKKRPPTPPDGTTYPRVYPKPQ
jgi:hypothetical protein